MKRSDLECITDMIHTGEEALFITENLTLPGLLTDRMKQLALERLIEIFGEAASGISPVTKGKYSDVPWRIITDMRNRLIHGYFNIDSGILLKTVQEDIPSVLPLLLNIQKDLENIS